MILSNYVVDLVIGIALNRRGVRNPRDPRNACAERRKSPQELRNL